MYRRRKRKLLFQAFILFGVLLLLIVAIRSVFSSPVDVATQVVHEFYKHEQVGDFSSSWKLFHSSMKEKFSKGVYIQDRAHVFMNHFGVDTFIYTLSKPEKLENWKMSKGAPPLKNIISITVTQTYKGKYGNFDLVQKVYVVKEKTQWSILWDYNQ